MSGPNVYAPLVARLCPTNSASDRSTAALTLAQLSADTENFSPLDLVKADGIVPMLYAIQQVKRDPATLAFLPDQKENLLTTASACLHVLASCCEYSESKLKLWTFVADEEDMGR